MSTNPVIPLVHLNGTAKKDLLHQYGQAYTAVRNAHYAMCAASPNARDYYPIDSAAYEAARSEYWRQAGKLEEVRLFLEDVIAGIDAQGK